MEVLLTTTVAEELTEVRDVVTDHTIELESLTVAMGGKADQSEMLLLEHEVHTMVQSLNVTIGEMDNVTVAQLTQEMYDVLRLKADVSYVDAVSALKANRSELVLLSSAVESKADASVLTELREVVDAKPNLSLIHISEPTRR